MFWGSKKNEADNVPAVPEKEPVPGAQPSTPQTQQQPRQQVVRHPVPSPAAASRPIARDELPRFLLSECHIAEDKIRHALKVQQETGGFIGDILQQEGVIDDKSLVSFLAKYCKIPHIGLLNYLIDEELFSLIPQSVCMKYHILPVDKMGKNLTVAMVNPLNNEALHTVRQCCPTLRIKPILCSYSHFETVARRLFSGEEGAGEAVSHAPASSLAAMPETMASAGVDEPVSPLPDEIKLVDDDVAAVVEEIQAEPELHVQEEQAAVPEPVEEKAGDAPTDREEAAAPDAESMDSNKLLDSVFGKVKVPEEDVPEAEPLMDEPLSTAEMTTLESVMHAYTDVMVNSMHDTYELLARKIPFFNGVPPEDVARIFSQGKVVEYEPAEMLFDKGDTGDTMYVILNGRVKIRDGAKQIAILHTGDIFGEMALVNNKPRSATAVTMTQSDFLVLSLDDILHNIPPNVAAQLLVNIIVTLAERLRIANQIQ